MNASMQDICEHVAKYVIIPEVLRSKNCACYEFVECISRYAGTGHQ
jgi:hypothetical protein